MTKTNTTTAATSKQRVTKQQATEWAVQFIEMLEKSRCGTGTVAERHAARQRSNEFILSLPERWMSRVPDCLMGRIAELC